MNELPLVRNLFPDIASVLIERLKAEGESALADQVEELRYFRSESGWVCCGRNAVIPTDYWQADLMSPVPQPPSRAQVESRFLALLDGSQSRDAVDRWASQWVFDADGGGVDDETVWWALNVLCGIDLRHGPGAPYLHDHEQIRDWLAEFRARCAHFGGH